MKLLEGKVALITGAGRGIGKAMAQVFVNQGAKVVVGDIKKEWIRKLLMKSIQFAWIQLLRLFWMYPIRKVLTRRFQQRWKNLENLDILDQ